MRVDQGGVGEIDATQVRVGQFRSGKVDMAEIDVLAADRSNSQASLRRRNERRRGVRLLNDNAAGRQSAGWRVRRHRRTRRP